MKNIILLYLLIIFSTISIAQADTIYYFSNDRNNKIICIYDSSKIGNFYYNYFEPNNYILQEYLKYGPLVQFLSNNIAEIKIPTGSPNYHCYYYNFENNSLSASFNLPIAFDIKNKLVAVLNVYSIEIYEVFTNKKKYSFKDNLIEPIKLLVSGRPKGMFVDNRFIIEYQSEEQLIKREFVLK